MDQNSFCPSQVFTLFQDFFQDWRQNVQGTRQYDQALGAVAVSKWSLFLHDPTPSFVLTTYLTSGPARFLAPLVLSPETLAIALSLTVQILNKFLKFWFVLIQVALTLAGSIGLTELTGATFFLAKSWLVVVGHHPLFD